MNEQGDKMDLHGKTALIVGAGRGIGRRTAELFARTGANVVISSRTEPELFELEFKLVSAGASEVLAIPCDASDPSDADCLIRQTFDRFETVEYVVLAAGMGVMKPFCDLSLKEFDESFRINTITAFNVLKDVLPSMKANRFGRVVAIPGVLGKAPMIGGSAYCASKYALTGMIKCLKEEYRRYGIRFSLMHFGGVDSSFWDNVSMKVDRSKMLTVNAAAEAVFFAATQEGEGVMSEVVLVPESHQIL